MSLWLLNHHRVSTWRLGRQLLRDVCKFPTEIPIARGLLVGEAPGPNTDPRMPLFPHPPNSAAARVLAYSRLMPSDYLGCLQRVNMCVNKWSDDEADSRILLITKWLLTAENRVDGRPLRVLLLGRKVQRAFGIDDKREFGYVRWDEIQIAWAPHPSGLCRVYNDATARERLGRRVRWCAGLPTSLHSSTG